MGTREKLIIAFSTTIVIGLLAVLIVLLIDWCNDKDGTTKIKYRQFRALQSVAPRKWKLYDGFVSYYSDHGDRNSFCFNFVEWVQYKFWRWKCKNEENNAKENKLMEKQIKEWQEDIDEYRERYNA